MELVDRRRGENQVVGEEQRDLAFDRAAENVDVDGHPGAAQCQRFLDIGDGHARHAGRLQCEPHVRDAVTVGIGLDNGHHFGTANMAADRGQVSAECVEIDVAPGRTHL